MLILSRAGIAVSGEGRVVVEGDWRPYQARIAQFVDDLGLRDVSVRHRFGRIVFSGAVDASTRQRIRNFLVNACPLKRR
jgi:hypothetical protein